MLKYEQIRILGQGGFGKAILARKKNTNGNKEEKVVIKEVQIFSLKPRDREVAFQEAKLLSTLKHPFIVSYIESFQERGNLYIVMEYADGGDLSQKVEKLREKRSSVNKYNHSPYAIKSKNSNSDCFMSEEEVLHDFIQISLAIKYIHDRKILHRDLKTQNIFLMKDGTTKLGDFGIARVLQNTFQLCKTQIGTPYYLSPELCEGKNYNSKTDIWSLGCILYELCTLNRAFDANNMNQLIVNIIRGKHKPIDSTHYSSDLRNLVDSMLTKDPSKRPSINQILRLPFIKNKLSSFLNEKLLNYEMQHTILHGRKPFAEPTLILPQNKDSILLNNAIKEENENRKKIKNDVKKVNKNLNRNANAKVVDINSNSLSGLNQNDLECTKQIIESEKKKLSLAQQKRLEYEEKLKEAHERRQRKLKQEAEEKERQLKEIQIQEKVKKSVQENKDLIRLPKRKRDDELQIDAEERRRIYLEQKQEMLRNKRRYEQDQQSLMKEIYGNEDPNEEIIKRQKKLGQMRQERLKYLNRRSKNPQNEIKETDNNNNNNNDNDNNVDLSPSKKGLSSSIRRLDKNEKNSDKNKNQIDMSEFYKQQRREARANKRRLDEALGIKNPNDRIKKEKDKNEIDMDKLIRDAEVEMKNDQNDNDGIDVKRSPSLYNNRNVKRKKQKDIPIEFLGMPKQSDKNDAGNIKRSRSAFDKEPQLSPQLKLNDKLNENKKSLRRIQPSPPGSPIMKPNVGGAAHRSPSEVRSSRPKSHLNASNPVKQIQNKSKADKDDDTNNNNDNNEVEIVDGRKRKIDRGEIERETEVKMQNAIEQASAIVDALEISTDYNDNEIDEFDDQSNFQNSNIIDSEEKKAIKKESEISEFSTKAEFDKGEAIPLIFKDKTMNFPIVKDSDSLAYRAEAIRVFLEQDIGIDKLIKLYNVLSNDNNTNDEKYEKYVDKIIAESGAGPGYILLIQQLIILDEKIGMQ